MPHIIIEYSEELFIDVDIQPLLKSIHTSIVNSGLFEESHIKTRAYPFKDFTYAGQQSPYIHVQARIKSGRTASDKKSLSEGILDSLKPFNTHASVMTVEIIDMDRESYSKHVN